MHRNFYNVLMESNHIIMEMDDQKCAICINYINIGAKAQVCVNNHYYHADCLDAWFKRSIIHVCPYCQQNIKINV